MATPEIPVTPQRPIDLDALTPEEARTLRRMRRRMTEGERQRGIKILRLAASQLERGKPDKALQAVLSGFGGIMLRGILEKLQGSKRD